jgi:hypothetical protein
VYVCIFVKLLQPCLQHLLGIMLGTSHSEIVYYTYLHEAFEQRLYIMRLVIEKNVQ